MENYTKKQDKNSKDDMHLHQSKEQSEQKMSNIQSSNQTPPYQQMCDSKYQSHHKKDKSIINRYSRQINHDNMQNPYSQPVTTNNNEIVSRNQQYNNVHDPEPDHPNYKSCNPDERCLDKVFSKKQQMSGQKSLKPPLQIARDVQSLIEKSQNRGELPFLYPQIGQIHKYKKKIMNVNPNGSGGNGVEQPSEFIESENQRKCFIVHFENLSENINLEHQDSEILSNFGTKNQSSNISKFDFNMQFKDLQMKSLKRVNEEMSCDKSLSELVKIERQKQSCLIQSQIINDFDPHFCDSLNKQKSNNNIDLQISKQSISIDSMNSVYIDEVQESDQDYLRQKMDYDAYLSSFPDIQQSIHDEYKLKLLQTEKLMRYGNSLQMKHLHPIVSEQQPKSMHSGNVSMKNLYHSQTNKCLSRYLNSNNKAVMLQDKVDSMNKQVKNTRVFLNMVIHDMRNPATSIQYAVSEALDTLKQYQKRIEKFKFKFNKSLRRNQLITEQQQSSIQIDQRSSQQISQNRKNKRRHSRYIEKNRHPNQIMCQSNKEQKVIPKIRQRSISQLEEEKYYESDQQNLNNQNYILDSQKYQPNSYNSKIKSPCYNQQECQQIVEPQISRNCEIAVPVQNIPVVPQFSVNQPSSMRQIVSEDDDRNESDEAFLDCEEGVNDDEVLKKVNNFNFDTLKQQCPKLKCDKEKCHVIFVDRFIPVMPKVVQTMDRGVQTDPEPDQNLDLQQQIRPKVKKNQQSEQINSRSRQNNSKQVKYESQKQQQINRHSSIRIQSKKRRLSSNSKNIQIQAQNIEFQSINQMNQAKFTHQIARDRNQCSGSSGLIPNNDLPDQQHQSQQLRYRQESDLILREAMDELMDNDFINKTEKLLQNTKNYAMVITNLITDLLDLAKLEQHTFSFNEEYFDLIKVFDDAIEQMRYQTDQKNIRMVRNIGAEDNIMDSQVIQPSRKNRKNVHYYDDKQLLKSIYGDPRRYNQIIINFLSNAVKFTETNGLISINIKVIEQQDFIPFFNVKKQRRSNSVVPGKQEISFQNNQIGEEKNIQFFNFKGKSKSRRSQSLKMESMDDNQDKRDVDKEKQDKNSPQQHQFQKVEKFIKFRITIQDTGIGIKKENLGKLFTDFTKLDEHSQINQQGTGLGLSICKKIVEKMGGCVQVDSEYTVGTVFTLDISTKVKVKKQTLYNIKEKISDPDSKEIIKRSLDQMQSSNQVNDNGMNDENDGDIVLNDYIKYDVEQSSIYSSDEKSSINEQNEEIKQINEYQPKFQLDRNEQEESRTKHQPLFKCLIVNDDPFQLMALGQNLSVLNIQYTKAVNGLQAYHACIQEQTGDLDFVIMDLNMPIMSGYDACKKIVDHYDPESKLFQMNSQKNIVRNRSLKRKKNEIYQSPKSPKEMLKNETGQCPYLFAMTSNATEDQVRIALSCGFLDVIETPLTTKKIQEKIIHRIKLEKQIICTNNKILQRDVNQSRMFNAQIMSQISMKKNKQNDKKNLNFSFNLKQNQ